jgi:hypothetical protein
MDLARELRRLDVDWPRTPELSAELAPRRRSRRRLLVIALAVLVVAVAAALAVPQSRGAILRFLHLGAVTIERVDTLPPAEDRPLEAGLGPVVTQQQASQAVRRLLLPPGEAPRLHRTFGNAISMVVAWKGEPVLLSELGDIIFFKKAASGGTDVEPVQVYGHQGVWIHGARHDVFFPGMSPRLAGNTLVWFDGEATTYRIEGRSLTLDAALELARSLRSDTP